jgi:hypothetical protein
MCESHVHSVDMTKYSLNKRVNGITSSVWNIGALVRMFCHISPYYYSPVFKMGKIVRLHVGMTSQTNKLANMDIQTYRM